MTWGLVAVGGATLLGGYMASNAQSDAANSASNVQQASSEAGIAENRRQFDIGQENYKQQQFRFDQQKGQHFLQQVRLEELRKYLKPYSDIGLTSLDKQKTLLGINGNGPQNTAINELKTSSQFDQLARQSEDGILQNASATGGLRGGNIQAALAQFRPQLLNQLIQQQFANLGGLTNIGQNGAGMLSSVDGMQGNNISSQGNNVNNQGISVANQGGIGAQFASNISNLLQQSGAAQAGNFLSQGKSQADLWSGITKGVGTFAAIKGGF